MLNSKKGFFISMLKIIVQSKIKYGKVVKKAKKR
jgi:hypothetical protein